MRSRVFGSVLLHGSMNLIGTRLWLEPYVTNANGFVLLVSYSPPCGGLSREVVWCVGPRVASLFSLSFLETLRAFL